MDFGTNVKWISYSIVIELIIPFHILLCEDE
jgi:hypothetical protein